MEEDVVVKFNVEAISTNDHHTEIRAHIFLSDDCIRTKIGFAELVQFNFANARDEGYGWLNLIDEIDDDIMDLFDPLVATNREFTDKFEDMCVDKLEEEPKSIIAIQKIFIKKEYRGKRLLKHILKAIRKFNYCPIALSPVPLQHACGDSNKELMGFEGNKEEAKRDFKRLSNYYEKNGFKRVGKSETWVLIN